MIKKIKKLWERFLRITPELMILLFLCLSLFYILRGLFNKQLSDIITGAIGLVITLFALIISVSANRLDKKG